jgi:hypothetical protein
LKRLRLTRREYRKSVDSSRPLSSDHSTHSHQFMVFVNKALLPSEIHLIRFFFISRHLSSSSRRRKIIASFFVIKTRFKCAKSVQSSSELPQLCNEIVEMAKKAESETKKVEVSQDEEPNLKGDYGNVFLLFLLYCLQGDSRHLAFGRDFRQLSSFQESQWASPTR